MTKPTKKQEKLFQERYPGCFMEKIGSSWYIICKSDGSDGYPKGWFALEIETEMTDGLWVSQAALGVATKAKLKKLLS